MRAQPGACAGALRDIEKAGPVRDVHERKAMARKNIPRRAWNDFLENLSAESEGWIASVEVIGDPDPDGDLELHDSTLDAFDFEIDEDQATVTVSFIDNKPIRIDDVVRVFQEEEDEQGSRILELETRAQTVRLWLRMPPNAENEDFLVPDLKEARADPPPAEEALEEEEPYS